MENIKFIGAQNEIQKIYSDLGLIVPVGDLDNGKAPAIQPLPATSTQDSITAKFNVMSGAEISSLSYKVNDGEATSITPAKGVVTITLSDLEHNSGPYEIELTATNETGSTVTTSTVALQHYTNWATPDEVLLGNKYIGEDGQEHTGEYETPTGAISITSNGTDIDVASYATANVNVQPTLETVPVTPTTSAQTITPSTGYDGIDQVNVSAVTSSIDANITAGNIKSGVTILGVTGTMSAGPTDGGATVQSCTMEHVQIDGMDIPCHTIVLDAMPEDIDPENNRYGVKVFALCYSSTNADPFNSPDIEHLADISGTELAEFDLENNTIYDYFCGSPQDQDFQDIASTSGYVVLYEDSFVNPIYKWPCTVITPTDSQQ